LVLVVLFALCSGSRMRTGNAFILCMPKATTPEYWLARQPPPRHGRARWPRPPLPRPAHHRFASQVCLRCSGVPLQVEPPISATCPVRLPQHSGQLHAGGVQYGADVPSSRPVRPRARHAPAAPARRHATSSLVSDFAALGCNSGGNLSLSLSLPSNMSILVAPSRRRGRGVTCWPPAAHPSQRGNVALPVVPLPSQRGGVTCCPLVAPSHCR